MALWLLRRLYSRLKKVIRYIVVYHLENLSANNLLLKITKTKLIQVCTASVVPGNTD